MLSNKKNRLCSQITSLSKKYVLLVKHQPGFSTYNAESRYNWKQLRMLYSL